ncbi:MAG: GAK system ATP-grasp enzyme [Nannocystaceae bacterium]
MTTHSPHVAVIGIPGAWSSELIAERLTAHVGPCPVVDLADARVDLDTGAVMVQGLDLSTLDGLVVKKIAPSYSAHVLDRVEILQWVEHRGVRVFSPARAMGPLINRLSGTVRLRRGGIPMPPTFVTESVDEAVRLIEHHGPCIAKPLYTSKGRGMTKLIPGDDLRAAVEDFHAAGNPVMYLQKMLELPGRDLGVAFVGGDYLATYARVQAAGSWKSTTSAGGKYEAVSPSAEIIDVARRAQALFELDFTCVDVVETSEGPMVFEVSAFGGFRGLLDACGVDAAEAYAAHVVRVLKDRARP